MVHRFKPGDLAVVRDWDDMVREFGLSSFGSVSTTARFVQEMRKTCGSAVKILEIRTGQARHVAHPYCYIEFLVQKWTTDPAREYMWDTGMLRPAASKYPTNRGAYAHSKV